MSPSSRRLPRRLLAAFSALTFVLGAVVAQVTLTAAPAGAADLASTPLITWNMQGANSDGHSKWNQVSAFAQEVPIPLLALQEVGAGPPAEDINLTENLQIAAANNPNNNYTVRHSQWRVGRFGIRLDVYFLRTQANGAAGTGGRVNTAIVIPRGADEVRVIENPGFRHVLGVRLGNTWYYTFHGRSSLDQNEAGSDGPGVLQTIANLTPPGEQWVVAGDFNREPEDLVIPAGATRYATNTATHEGTRELDYVVASQFVPNLPRTNRGLFLSDHAAVQVGTLRAAATPTLDTSRPQAIESMQAGGLVDVTGGRTANGSGVATFHRNRAANQAWLMDLYSDNSVQFRGVASGRCLDIHNSNTATAGRNLDIFDCKGIFDTTSQRWTLEDLGDDQVRIHSVLRPDLCMNVAGGRNTPDGPPMIVWPCTDDPNERFVFTPADASGTPRALDPTGVADDTPGFHSVESMQAGGLFDVTGGRTANNSGVATFHRNRGTNQGWEFSERSDAAVQLRGVASGRCLDIHNSDSVSAGRDLVVFDCKSGDSQWWTVEDVGNQQVRFRSALRPDLCINVAGGRDTPDGPQLIVWPCTSDPNERFVLTPYDPSGAPVRDHDEL